MTTKDFTEEEALKLLEAEHRRCHTPDLEFRDRGVVDLEWEGSGVDSFFTHAAWADTHEPLTDDELGELTDSDGGQEYLVEANFERHHYYRK